MKNRYEIRGDVTVVYATLPRGRGEVETFISTHRLPLIQQIHGHWKATWSERTRNYYVRGKIGRKDEPIHRLIMGDPDGYEIDHVDRNTLNNVDSNLRLATRSNNQQNKRLQSNNTTGYRGVIKRKSGKYQARGTVDGTRYNLGYYNTAEEAHRVVRQFRLRHMPFSEDDKVESISSDYDFLNNLDELSNIFKCGSSTYWGVTREKNRWAAKYSLDGVSVFAGYFTFEIDAAYAHDTYTRLYGKSETSHINFPDVNLSVEEIEKRKYNRGNKSSQYVGVTRKPNGQWGAQFYDGKKTRFIGTFDHEVTASIARDIALFKQYGHNLPKRTKFNHPDIFNSSTVTWSTVDKFTSHTVDAHVV